MSSPGTFPGAGLPPLRVRTLRALPVRFCIDFGQRNAVFLKRPLTARRLAVWAESFAPVPEPGYDLTHSFNAVPVLTRRPFLVSFESFLPRFPDDHDHGALAAPALGLARGAPARAPGRTSAASPASRSRSTHAASSSTRPPRRRTAPRSRRSCASAIRSCRCGGRRPSRARASSSCCSSPTASWARAGRRLLRAHERLRAAGVPVTTTVVSELAWEPDDYIGPGSRALVEREHRRARRPGRRAPAQRPQRARARADGGGRLLRPADVPRHVRLRRAGVARGRHARDRLGHLRAARDRRARQATAT